MAKKNKNKHKDINPRSFVALAAKVRTSAGAMRDRRERRSKEREDYTKDC